MTITLPAHARVVHEGDSVRIDLNDKDAAKALFDELAAKREPDEAERLYRHMLAISHEEAGHFWPAEQLRSGVRQLEPYALAAVAHLRTELARIKDAAWNEALDALVKKLDGWASVGIRPIILDDATALKRPVA